MIIVHQIIIKGRIKVYKTKEELEQAWPLGTVISEEPVFQRFYCADQITFNKIQEWFKGDTVEQTSPHHVTVQRMSRKTIEGYLYNGESWFPVTRNGQEWEIYFPEVF